MLVKKPKSIKKLKQQWVPCMHSCKNSKHSTPFREFSWPRFRGRIWHFQCCIKAWNNHYCILLQEVSFTRPYSVFHCFLLSPLPVPSSKNPPFPLYLLGMWCVVCACVCLCMCVCLFLCSLELSWERKGTIFVIFFWLLLLTMIHVSECKL